MANRFSRGLKKTKKHCTIFENKDKQIKSIFDEFVRDKTNATEIFVSLHFDSLSAPYTQQCQYRKVLTVQNI